MYDCHIDPVAVRLPAFRIQGDRIFLFNPDIRKVGDDTRHRYSRKLLHQLLPGFKKADIPSEFIDDDPFYQSPLFRTEQLDRSVNRPEYTSPVDVGHQVCSSTYSHSHPHIGNIPVTQVDL